MPSLWQGGPAMNHRTCASALIAGVHSAHDPKLRLAIPAGASWLVSMATTMMDSIST
jgi:hypothetical protein